MSNELDVLDINDIKVAKKIKIIIDLLVEKKFEELVNNLVFEQTGIVAVSGSGATVPLYINKSTIATDVKNSYSLSLVAGQSVKVICPKFKNDSSRYISRIG